MWHKSLVGLQASKPEPFLSKPVVYEAAYGGRDPGDHSSFDEDNPVGVGFAKRAADLRDTPVPSIEYLRAAAPSWNKPAEGPAGLGAIATHWRGRAQFSGTYDTAWREHRRPLLPQDFDERFLQSAPPDQQVPLLKGGERIALKNLTPNGLLAFCVPRVVLVFHTRFDDQDIEHRPDLHTITVEPDLGRVTVVWHTRLLCQGKVERLRETIIRQKEVLGA
jgi:hypothetical protein